jgi:hypothetical protein
MQIMDVTMDIGSGEPFDYGEFVGDSVIEKINWEYIY